MTFGLCQPKHSIRGSYFYNIFGHPTKELLADCHILLYNFYAITYLSLNVSKAEISTGGISGKKGKAFSR